MVIVRKFGGLFYGVPLSTTGKRGHFYHPFIYSSKRGHAGESVALLSHMRSMDSRRLLDKDGMMPKADFESLKIALGTLILGLIPPTRAP